MQVKLEKQLKKAVCVETIEVGSFIEFKEAIAALCDNGGAISFKRGAIINMESTLIVPGNIEMSIPIGGVSFCGVSKW